MKFFLPVILFSLAINSAYVTAEVYPCEPQSLHRIQEDLRNSDSKKQLAEVAAQGSQFLVSCRTRILPSTELHKDTVEDFYRLVDEVLNAQLKTRQFNDCIALGLTTTDAWDSPFKMLKPSSLSTRVEKTLRSCQTKRDKTLNYKFAAKECPLFGDGHKYSSAILAPTKWLLNKQDHACLYLYGGKNRAIPEEEGIRLRENSPYLILLTKEGDNVYERYIDFTQGKLGSKDFCLSGRIAGVDFLTTASNTEQPLIRIRHYVEHCLRDNAAFAMDSVYRIDQQQGLVPVDELLINLRP